MRTKRLLFFLVIFLVAVITCILFNEHQFETLYVTTPDGNLYLSVAKNYIENGHFIQNARPYEINMVVPPGLPFILTIFLFIFNSKYVIITYQYILFGLSIVMLAETVRKITKSYISATSSSIIYLLIWNKLTEPNPSQILTEVHTIFGLSLFLFVYTREIKKTIKICLLWFVSFFILLVRPICGFIILIPIAMMINDLHMLHKADKSLSNSRTEKPRIRVGGV